MKFTDCLRRAAPWACAGVLAVPQGHAAELSSMDAAPPFVQYQPWRDSPVADWRALNQRVDDIGGWRTYLRESLSEGAMNDEHAHHGHHGHHHH